ncbi:hypothetical protein Y032_0044g933 [Ancylostoma ceylanicum]|uniref:Uncharacterized protein n=1 Tax=Ancylostoma ceylanicum TaxID=53326 RepID=A0A016UDU7_9BILA|nr:hypothetical protein Y032_0044g933 [Ancylostoma ceylanicum]
MLQRDSTVFPKNPCLMLHRPSETRRVTYVLSYLLRRRSFDAQRSVRKGFLRKTVKYAVSIGSNPDVWEVHSEIEICISPQCHFRTTTVEGTTCASVSRFKSRLITRTKN